jgi:hypothetical protein
VLAKTYAQSLIEDRDIQQVTVQRKLQALYWNYFKTKGGKTQKVQLPWLTRK